MNELYESGDVEPLSDDGYISQVTGKGWHRFELTAKKTTWEFIRSIFCPIIVALLTSLLVGFFKG